MEEFIVTTGDKPIILPGTRMVTIYIMGKPYKVPETLTIQKAIEFAGYQYIRSSGCRGGICGACGTVYRRKNDPKLYGGLACQTVVEDGMYLTQIPFYPAERKPYKIEELKATPTVLAKIYPEVMKCVQCNNCTKICPKDLDVMQYIAYAMRGDLKKVSELSAECVMCGLCASRCSAEMPQYNIAMLARRLYGKYLLPESQPLLNRVEEVKSEKYNNFLAGLVKKSKPELIELYEKREIEPGVSEGWIPEETEYL